MNKLTAWIILVPMILIGLYDLCLVWMKKSTLSQWIQRWQPKYVDTIIFFGLMILAWILWGEIGFIKILYGCLAVHFFVEQPR